MCPNPKSGRFHWYELFTDLQIQQKKNPFGKPQAEVDFACVYNL